MPVVRLDGLLDLDVPRRRNAPCAFNYIIYPIFVQCYVMGRFGHENGPFWMLAGAVLALFFSSTGAVFDLHWGRFGDGPFWSVPNFSTKCCEPHENLSTHRGCTRYSDTRYSDTCACCAF